MTLHLSEADVEAVLTPAEAFAAVEGSLLRAAAGRVDEAPRIRLPVEGGVFAVMAAVDPELGYAGLKSYAWLAPAGTPFVVVLFSLEHACVEAVVEADRLGRLRTAAASAVAATRLAAAEPRSLGVIGCGRQAAAHVAALRAALPTIERLAVHGRDESRVAAFCARHGADSAAASEAGACDVVVTATTSRDPVLRGDWLRPGALVIAVGANDPTARELDDALLARASFVCTDSLAQARGEAGDLIQPVEHGVLDWLEVHELQAVVAGEVAGRATDEDVVVFKSNGLAAWDVAAAARVLELARAAGLGRAY